MHLIVYL